MRKLINGAYNVRECWMAMVAIFGGIGSLFVSILCFVQGDYALGSGLFTGLGIFFTLVAMIPGWFLNRLIWAMERRLPVIGSRRYDMADGSVLVEVVRG